MRSRLSQAKKLLRWKWQTLAILAAHSENLHSGFIRPYYGYGAGVVRLSLGDNSELGGAVGGGYVRWNFFTDTTVTVNGDIWVDDGKLVR